MFSEQDALTLINNKEYLAFKNTGYYICNYYSRWSEGKKYVIEKDGKLYNFVIYGRPKERESDASINTVSFYNHEVKLKELSHEDFARNNW